MGLAPKNRPSLPGGAKLTQGPNSLLGAAVVGALVVSDRLSFGDVGVAFRQLPLPDLGSHGVFAAGQYGLVASRLSLAAQQVVSSLDFSPSSERFLVDARAGDAGLSGSSFSLDVSGAAAYVNSAIGSAVPPELRGLILSEGSSPGSGTRPVDSGRAGPATTYRTADEPNQGSTYLKNRRCRDSAGSRH